MPLSSTQVVSQTQFPTTHWAVVLSSKGASNAAAAALEELCRAYWSPLYAFLRRKGVPQHDAQDLVQGFLQRLLERRDLDTLTPEKGRLRTYLLTALRNFTIKQAERAKASKRGGGQHLIPLDAEEAERLSLPDHSADSPEAAYDRQWARATLGRAMARLRAEHVARNKEAFFESLAPLLEGADPNDYEVVGARLGMKKGAVAVAVHRLRGRLRELFRSEVLQTVASHADADDELRQLLEALVRS